MLLSICKLIVISCEVPWRQGWGLWLVFFVFLTEAQAWRAECLISQVDGIAVMSISSGCCEGEKRWGGASRNNFIPFTVFYDCPKCPLPIRKRGQNHRASGEALWVFDSGGKQNKNSLEHQGNHLASVQNTVKMREKWRNKVRLLKCSDTRYRTSLYDGYQ